MGKIYSAFEKAKADKQRSTTTDSEKSHSLNFKYADAANSEKADELNGNIVNKPPSPERSSASQPTIQLTDLDQNLITALKPYSSESEQFRQLKNNILFPDKGLAAKTIMVTSTGPDEGKSFVSANLAVIIAQSIDEHVLLIDGDLRKPSIHKMFGYSSCDGLSQYLSERKPLSSLLCATPFEKLTILPGGHVPSNPSELLSSEQMRALIQEVKMRYTDRYVIIDTPPPYLTSETNALARNVDGILLVVKKRGSNLNDLKGLIDIYGKEKILGVVMNFSHKRSKYGYNYYKYGYGK